MSRKTPTNAGKGDIYLPLFMLYIYYTGNILGVTGLKISKKMKIQSSTSYKMKTLLIKEDLICDIESKDNREKSFELTEKGKKVYDSVCMLISTVGGLRR